MAESIWHRVLVRFFEPRHLDEILETGIDKVLDRTAASPDPSLRKIFEGADESPNALLKAMENAKDYCAIQADRLGAKAARRQDKVDALMAQARKARGINRDLLKEQILQTRRGATRVLGLRRTWSRSTEYWDRMAFRLRGLIIGSTVPEGSADLLEELEGEAREKQQELEGALAATDGGEHLSDYTEEEKAELDAIEAELRA